MSKFSYVRRGLAEGAESWDRASMESMAQALMSSARKYEHGKDNRVKAAAQVLVALAGCLGGDDATPKYLMRATDKFIDTMAGDAP
jgi:hypothetical protein